MPFDPAVACAELNSVISEFEKDVKTYASRDSRGLMFYNWSFDVVCRHITSLQAALARWAPSGYGDEAITAARSTTKMPALALALSGVAQSLRNDIIAGRTKSFAERLHSDLFTDFLAMAIYLIEDEGLKDPAAVLAGGVLEEHLRKLCPKHGVDTTFVDRSGATKPKRLDTMNAELAKAGAYGAIEQKQIVAWAGIRNAAAHAERDKFDANQAKGMIQGIRDFVAKYPA